MKEKQNAIRLRLKEYHNKYGTPYNTIAKDVNITGAYLRMFVNGNRETVSESVARSIDNYLIERGY